MRQRVDDLYWRVLSRAPSDDERSRVIDLWKSRGGGKKGSKARSGDLLRDVAWCLFNTKEFLFRI
jgi:hypothetical protein